MSLTLLIGGARAGKSDLAVALAERAGKPVSFVATARAIDEEMADRIERHRAERPSGWVTVEAPVDLRGALGRVPEGATAIVDCLTLWVSNLLEDGCDDEEVVARAEAAAEAARARDGRTIAVTNEVGAGIVPMHPLSRRYRDLLGRVNAIWASRASRALLVVAGRVLPLEEGWVPLDEEAGRG